MLFTSSKVRSLWARAPADCAHGSGGEASPPGEARALLPTVFSGPTRLRRVLICRDTAKPPSRRSLVRGGLSFQAWNRTPRGGWERTQTALSASAGGGRAAEHPCAMEFAVPFSPWQRIKKSYVLNHRLKSKEIKQQQQKAQDHKCFILVGHNGDI